MLSTLIAFTMLLATKHRAVLPPPHVDFYVATNGSDSYSGTLSNSNSRGTDGPFASIDRARRAVASLRASQPARTSPVVVMVRGGVYTLASTFGLGSGDSGTAQSQTIYENFPGEAPVFSGGVRVTGWTNTSTPRFLVQGGCLYSDGAPYISFQDWNRNMYWRTDGQFANDNKAFAAQPAAGTGPQAPCAGSSTWTFYPFSGWQQTVGEDLQSVIQNPGFANPAYPADDYSLPHGSPGAGFVVFDASQAGRVNPGFHPPAVPATFPTKTFDPATDF